MRLPPVLVIVVLSLASALLPSVYAPATYTLTVNPGVPVNQGTTMTFTLTLTGGSRNGAYNVVIGVTKPNGTGQAATSRTVLTDNRGNGGIGLPYPDPSFTPLNGTVATDVGGIYAIQVNQTGPSFQANVATAQFTVISQLTVVLAQPTTGSYVQRGQKIAITASVSSPGGPDTTATVSANAPGNGRIYLQQISTGIYTADYSVLVYDPIGPWIVTVTASDPSGNSGKSGPVGVSVRKADLVVDSLTAYNAKGVATSDFSPGDTVYPFFRLKYSSGDFLTSGQYRVAIKNTAGQEIANLTAVYDGSRFGFYTTTGYQVSQFDTAGSWVVSVDAGSIDDGFGNTGPFYTTTVKIQIVALTSPWGYIPFAIAGMLAIVSGAFLFKKYDKSNQGFEYLERLMGGPAPRGSSIIILGDPGSGKTILSYEFLHDELENGNYCAVLSYDAFPEDVQARMMEFGWDITSHLRKGRLKIVDCYSGLAGEGEGAIKDPSDLTELNIRVTSIIGRAKGKPLTLVLDSLTPIFNGVDAKQAITFLQTVGAKIKKTGGVFFLTATTGAVAADTLAKTKSFMEGIIELTSVRIHREITRYLSVVKMERRKISTESVRFDIDRKRGFVFHVSRLKTSLTRNMVEQPKSTASAPRPDSQQVLTLPERPKTRDANQSPVLTKQSAGVLPQWGKRDGAQAKSLINNYAEENRTPSLFGRLKAASDRLWGVPPTIDRTPAALSTMDDAKKTEPVAPPLKTSPLENSTPSVVSTRVEGDTKRDTKQESQPPITSMSSPSTLKTKTQPATSKNKKTDTSKDESQNEDKSRSNESGTKSSRESSLDDSNGRTPVGAR